MPPASVILSITGGAQDFQISPMLQAAFSHGIATAARDVVLADPGRRVERVPVQPARAASECGPLLAVVIHVQSTCGSGSGSGVTHNKASQKADDGSVDSAH